MDDDFDDDHPIASAHSFGANAFSQLNQFRQMENLMQANAEANRFGSIANTNLTTSLAQLEHEQTTMPNDMGMGIMNDKELQEEIHSLGTGSFTTNTFNLKLQGSAGMKILKYI